MFSLSHDSISASDDYNMICFARMDYSDQSRIKDKAWDERCDEKFFSNKYILWNHFYSWVPIFAVFMGRLIHQIKNPMNNETWEAVWHRYIGKCCPWVTSTFWTSCIGTIDNFDDKIVRAYLLMGYNPHGHVWELFDF